MNTRELARIWRSWRRLFPQKKYKATGTLKWKLFSQARREQQGRATDLLGGDRQIHGAVANMNMLVYSQNKPLGKKQFSFDFFKNVKSKLIMLFFHFFQLKLEWCITCTFYLMCIPHQVAREWLVFGGEIHPRFWKREEAETGERNQTGGLLCNCAEYHSVFPQPTLRCVGRQGVAIPQEDVWQEGR